MSYESKVYIGMRKELETPKGIKMVMFSELASFDLSVMGSERVNGKEFYDCFTTPIDFNLYEIPNADEDKYGIDDPFWHTDRYGEHIKYTSVDTVLHWLEQSETAKTYRRAKTFLPFLRSLQENKDMYDGELIAIHYGF